jgi:superfamily I DNA/RNA helicase
MAQKACDPVGGRIIAVGDELQRLYSWRGADSTIIETIRNIPTTKTLPLPISYRCPQKVISLAKKWATDLDCPKTAIEGEIHDISLNELYQKATPGCFILSRTNAPLIKICLGLIKNDKKANIRGRDVGKGLVFLLKKSKKKQIPAFLKWLENWKNEELIRLQEKNINPENTLDRFECLENLCEDSSTIEEVIEKVNSLFNDIDENNVIMLSTVHRSKGLQADDVFVLHWTFRVWFEDMEFLEKPSEPANISYVAVTRCVKRLFVVKKPSKYTKYDDEKKEQII